MSKFLLYSQFLSLVFYSFVSANIQANELNFYLEDQNKKPLDNAVITLSSPSSSSKPDKPLKPATIRQRNKTYIPHVSVIQTGTRVTFLNEDPLKHHVYSFSEAKRFEIKLYSGKPKKDILFDKPGLVTLGCNIHDNMLAYAYIVDTPYYGITDKHGKARLKDIPNGAYRLKIEHPQQKKNATIQQQINLPAKNNNVSYQLPLKPMWSQMKQRHSSHDFFEEDY